MRLKHLKVAGFKSFVDPTIIPFTQSLSAVVGPNGCGKSNIIDAVRWVLGESSAKNLRGDDMTDVIFNGSHSRKPVSVASVELLFDNSDGSAKGPWESFSEIAIKRQVSRQGQSDYFVNGQKCRRRDITDLLSGTGLGPRSYSIIEQGMISKLVESKPAELRGFIEDAAGISKYKERKRDTLNRIRNSRENLSRLNDLHHELTIQIQSLESQAAEAKKYTQLKEQERALNTDIVVLRWKTFNNEFTQTQINMDEAAEQLSIIQEHLSELNNDESEHKKSLNVVQQQLETINENYHEQHEQITRLSLNIEHKIQARQQQQHQLEQLTLKKENVSAQLNHAKQQQANNDSALIAAKADVEPAIVNRDELKTQQAENNSTLESIENQLFALTQEKQQMQGEHQLYRQQIDGLNNQRLKTNSQIELLNSKYIELTKQRQQLNPENLSTEYQQSQLRLQQLTADVENAKELVDLSHVTHKKLQQTFNDNEQRIAILSQERKGIERQINALSQQDDTALMTNFSEEHQFWKFIDVEPQWQIACDVILEDALSGFIVPSLLSENNLPAHCQLWSVSHAGDEVASNKTNHPLSLLRFVRGKDEQANGIITALLNDVLCVETHQQAVEIQPTLIGNQRVVSQQGNVYTRYGYWHHSINVDNHNGLVTLNNMSGKLNNDIDSKTTENKQTHALIVEQEALLAQHISVHQQCQSLYQSHSNIVNDTKQQWLLEQQQWEHVSTQLDEVNQQIKELSSHDVIEHNAIDDLEKSLLVTREKLSLSDNKLDTLKQEKSLEKQVSKKLQKQIDLTLSQVHENQLIVQKLEMQLLSDTKQVALLFKNLEDINNEHSEIQRLYNENQAPLNAEQQKLSQLKAAQHELTDNKNKLSAQLQQLNKLQVEQSNKLQAALKDKNKHQKRTEQLHVKRETLKVKLQSQMQQIALNERDIAVLATQLTDVNNAKQWPEELDVIRHQLAAMGAINLTAIEQYNEQKLRLDELTAQCNDLDEGLLTLEKAIKKIDRQSRDKFKKTFDSVNADFQTLFPKVFGGGSAQLTLTDSDLLLAGVSIMAQPPGKKNSTIHLLSGGEKALTALSLVFAIFQLNPAPFCMLDEVDAPLDDANVDRYCNLVKEMSEKVQFIYITHNKVSMEMATQLTGVTMQEAGVSRIVAVDVDAAISMAQQ